MLEIVVDLLPTNLSVIESSSMTSSSILSSKVNLFFSRAILLDLGSNACSSDSTSIRTPLICELNLITGSVYKDKYLTGGCGRILDSSNFSSHYLIVSPFGPCSFFYFSFLVPDR